jgi:CheY-like chemotaxis protein
LIPVDSIFPPVVIENSSSNSNPIELGEQPMDTAFRSGPGGSEGSLGLVMLVDDDCMLLDTTTRMISALGFEVIQAVDGHDALEQFQAHLEAISLVIMDITMPRMGGIEATKKIRELKPFAKIILSSGFTDQPISEAKADAYLMKPYRGRALCEVIQQVMKGDLKVNLLKLGVYGTH